MLIIHNNFMKDVRSYLSSVWIISSFILKLSYIEIIRVVCPFRDGWLFNLCKIPNQLNESKLLTKFRWNFIYAYRWLETDLTIVMLFILLSTLYFIWISYEFILIETIIITSLEKSITCKLHINLGQ